MSYITKAIFWHQGEYGIWDSNGERVFGFGTLAEARLRYPYIQVMESAKIHHQEVGW